MPAKLASRFKQYSFIFSSILFFAAAALFLIETPKIVELAESKVAFLGNQPQVKPVFSKQQVEVAVTPTISIENKNIPQPEFSAQAVLAQDLDSGQVLFGKNIHNRLPPASTTKIVSALIAQEYFKPGEILTVPVQAIVGGSSMGVSKDEKLTFRSLLYGMLLNSGNDAAYTIALNYPGGIDVFVDKMNEKVKQLNLADSHFQNPAGFDSEKHYSSAYDLAVFSKAAALDPYLSKIVATKETSILAFDKTKVHHLKNLNKLLSEEGILGIKTGFTEKAGENFVGLAEKNGHKILTVVLSSQDRFGETKRLIDWVYSNFEWRVQ